MYRFGNGDDTDLFPVYNITHTTKLVTGRVGLFKECLRGHRLVNTMLRRNKSHSHCWNVNTCMAAFKFFGNKQ